MNTMRYLRIRFTRKKPHAFRAMTSHRLPRRITDDLNIINDEMVFFDATTRTLS